MTEFAITLTPKKSRKSSNRKEKEDKVFDLYAEMLIKKLEVMQGNGKDWDRPWFTVGFAPVSIRNRHYNGMNDMLLSMLTEEEGWKYPVFLTKHNMNELEIQLVDDEQKPLPVFLSNPVYYNAETNTRLTHKQWSELDESEQDKYKKYRNRQIYDVFNICQTDMETANPELFKKLTEQFDKPLPKTDTSFSFKPIDTMIAENKWLCPITPKKQDKAFYTSNKDFIIVPLKEQFKSGERFYGTTLHEMAHSTGHEDRLHRKFGDKFGDKQYAKEELIAEMTSAIVAHQNGFSKDLKGDSLPYLKNWLASLKEEPRYIKDILYSVKQAANMINNEINKLNI